MRLITSNEQLSALLPNIQVTVTGETPLIDKLSPFLSATEKWLSDVFTSQPVLDTICQLADEDALRAATTQAVVYEAFRRAIPHLDVILTPNGFGIVSNTNIAPASKERINRLLDTLLDNRDAALSQVLSLLSGHDSWLTSSQAKFFRATMFPNMEGQLRCEMNFRDALRAIRYSFLLAKKLNLRINEVQLAALSLDYKQSKSAVEQAQVAEVATEVAQEVAAEAEQGEPSDEKSEAPEEVALGDSPIFRYLPSSLDSRWTQNSYL